MNKPRKNSYQIKWKESAVKSVSKFPKEIRERIVEKVDELRDSPFLGEPLSGDLKGLRRIKIGDYRIIYFVDTDKVIIIVVKVGHRSEIYR
ncbi:MAG: type II toxin-antitoxin system RelE/ParE family toxin [Caldisericum sp.]|jgi:mRNA interferase RelE/StbE|nr:type II toxin-antitoxin system RelE/ParE family toxin [Caldisericum sp.]